MTVRPAAHVDRRVRVMFILNSLCVGGAEKHVVSLINRLDSSRFNVSLLYLKREEELLPQLDTSRCPNGLECLDVKRGMDFGATRGVARHIDEREVDVVVCTNMYALLYGWIGRARARRKPKMVEIFHTTDVGSRKEGLEMRLLYPPLVRMTDLLVYVCGNQAAKWRAEGLKARREAIIYNGIDTSRFQDVWTAQEKAEVRARHGLATDDYVVSLCAVMRPEKAHGDLVSAVAELARRGVPVKCLMIGDGPERARVEQQVREAGLEGRVIITGFLQDVRPLIAASDVMVLTSHSVETFSLAALEAMSLDKPMVMTRIGGAPEQIESGVNGLMYEPGDIPALADALAGLANADVRQRMGSAAAAMVRERFDVAGMVRQFESAFAEVAGAPAPSACASSGTGRPSILQ